MTPKTLRRMWGCYRIWRDRVGPPLKILSFLEGVDNTGKFTLREPHLGNVDLDLPIWVVVFAVASRVEHIPSELHLDDAWIADHLLDLANIIDDCLGSDETGVLISGKLRTGIWVDLRTKGSRTGYRGPVSPSFDDFARAWLFYRLVGDQWGDL